MTTVKNVSLAPIDLPDGRLLRPGGKAERVDITDPQIAARIDHGAIVEVPKPKRRNSGDTTNEEPKS